MPEKDDLKTNIDSNYRLVILAAKRAKQLQKGARPRIQHKFSKPTRIALEEVMRGLVPYEQLPTKSNNGLSK